MQDDDFEWDDNKAAQNLAKHTVSFDTARLAFDDAFGVSRQDVREAFTENRFLLLAMAHERLLAVVYAIRNERVRIISARPAEPRERRWYHEQDN